MSSSDFQCGPCGNEHISKDAEKWCTNCDKGICKDCEKVHMSTKSDHKLIGIDDYQKASHISIRQTCDEHGKVFDQYCKTHDSVLCVECCSSQHKLCEEIIPLEEAAKNAKTSIAFTDLEDAISVFLKNVQSIIQHTTSADLDKQEQTIREEIKEIRTEINNRLDEIEQKLTFELESKLAKYASKFDAVLKHTKESEKLMKRLKEQTTEMKQFTSDLQVFLVTRQINRELQESLTSTPSEYNMVEKYDISVEINPVLNSLLTEIKTFGNINVEVTEVPLSQPKTRQAQIHVAISATVGANLKQRFTIKKESGRMNVTGCTILPNGQLLIADYFGRKQLMQYNQNGTHVRDIPVSSTPYDLTVIDSERVGVSYGKALYIEILNIKTNEVEKTVGLGNNTWGLSYHDGKLYVVVYSRGLFVVDLSGEILGTLDIDLDIVDYMIATSNRIIFSELQTDAVVCCDMAGKQIWQFQDDSVVYPVGLTVDKNKNVFVVGCDSNSVTMISRDGKTSKTLLTESDGLHSPRAISFSKDTGDLLVCNSNDQGAALFKITS